MWIKKKEGLKKRKMDGMELIGNMIMEKFGEGIDIERNDKIRENEDDEGENCLDKGRGKGGWEIMINGFIDNVIWKGGREILILLKDYKVKMWFWWKNEDKLIIKKKLWKEREEEEEWRNV